MARAGPAVARPPAHVDKAAGAPDRRGADRKSKTTISTPPLQAAAPVLRGYQVALLDGIRQKFVSGARRVLAVAPTGSGKTVAFAAMTRGAALKGRRVLLTGHRAEIVEQISAALDAQSVAHGLIAPTSAPTDDPVQVASLATIARRLDQYRERFDFVIVDESHHCVAGSWRKAVDAFSFAKVVGFTATPERLDGRGLGDVFDSLVLGPTTADLIEAVHLSKFQIFAGDPVDLSAVRIRGDDFTVDDLRKPMSGVVVQSAVREYRRLCDGVPSVAFCVDREHSRAVAAAFRAVGYRAEHIDGETPASERRSAIIALGDGSLDIICNCALFSEGLDVPGVGCALLLRPTQSLALYLQQVGRALRPSPGKEKAVILDFSGNVLRHGLPDDPRDWSLNSKPRERSATAVKPHARRCPDCGAVHRLSQTICDDCGSSLLSREERREIAMRLSVIEDQKIADALRQMSYRTRIKWAGPSRERLGVVRAIFGYKRGWVAHRLREFDGARSA